MENIITMKEGTIQNMKKIMENNNQEMDKLEEEIANCKKNAENKELMLEEIYE